MKNGELYLLKKVLEDVSSLGTNSFKLVVLINEELVLSRTKKLDKLIEPSYKINEYREKHRELLTNLGEKDETGNVILYEKEFGEGKIVTHTGNGFPNLKGKEDEFKAKSEELIAEYKEAIDAHDLVIKNFNSTLDEEAESLAFVKFKVETMPELTYQQLKALKPLIDL